MKRGLPKERTDKGRIGKLGSPKAGLAHAEEPIKGRH